MGSPEAPILDPDDSGHLRLATVVAEALGDELLHVGTRERGVGIEEIGGHQIGPVTVALVQDPQFRADLDKQLTLRQQVFAHRLQV